LKAAFEKHEGETEEHVNRLEKVFAELDETPRGKMCDAIMGIIGTLARNSAAYEPSMPGRKLPKKFCNLHRDLIQPLLGPIRPILVMSNL
jgi:hypothetical protein